MADKSTREKENPSVSENTQINNEQKEEGNTDQTDTMKTGIKSYQQSLPHVLSDYGLQNNTQKKKKSAKIRKERRNKRKTEILEGDDERDKEREKLREEKYLSVVDDLQKLRNYYYREYRDLLTEKIVRQRLEIKEKSKAMLALAREKEQEERNANKSKVKMSKHKLVHNEDFLKNIQVTETAKIVNLQTKLQKQGKLKSQSDIDEFWRTIRNPDVYEKYFDKNRGETPDSVFGKVAASTRPLSQINESAESSRPTTRGDNWAVTQQYKHQHKGTGLNRQKATSSTAKQSMDKRFASVDMPPLHCFTMDLSEKPPDPEVISKRVQLKAIEKQRKKFMGKLHKMHQLAMANNALASRILAQHEDLTMFLQGPELSDLISDYYYNKPSSRQIALPAPPTPRGTTSSTVSTKQYPILPEIPSRRNSDTSLHSSQSEQLEDTQLHRANSDVTSECKVRMIMEKPSSPLPLTMNEVMEHYKVVESKGLSSNWSNYMRAGKAM